MSRPHPILDRPAKTVVSKYSRGGWVLLECRETGLVYLDNPPDYTELEDTYAWERSLKRERAARKAREPLFAAVSAFSKRLRKTFRIAPRKETLPLAVARRVGEGRARLHLLDIGCGNGRYGSLLADRIGAACRLRVIPMGIEISRELAGMAQKEFEARGGSVIRSPALMGIDEAPDASIDLMMLHSFLEHEVHPLELMQACREKLTLGGAVIIKVPNFASWNRRIRQHRWCGFRFPDHVNYFTPESLRLLLDHAGFGIERMGFFECLPTSDNLWCVAAPLPANCPTPVEVTDALAPATS
ncbi:MAG: class I SAM-dependent methyltransferase [Opitutales bacterium]